MNTEKLISWLKFSALMAFVPGVFALLAEIVEWLNYQINDKFWDLSWGVKIASYIVIGFLVSSWYLNYLKTKKQKH